MYFGRKENDELKIYELEVTNEGKGFYEVQLKDTNEGRLLIKENKGKLLSDGIFADTQEEIEEAYK